jgi:hypothetical protein
MAGARYKIIDGVHRGKVGHKIGETEKFVKIQVDDQEIRCKKEFIREYLENPCLEIPSSEADLQMVLFDEIEKSKQREISKMIEGQNREYEESLKIDKQRIDDAREREFEEVSIEEMRRVRLLRFQ